MTTPNGDICPIGVFDSGLGGLSVLSEIHKLLPHENLIYVGDSANAPYGDRSSDYVKTRSCNVANFLLDQGVKAIVIACNTATAESATLLREMLDVPVIGLEPAVKPASLMSKSGVIGILATQRTIDSDRLLRLTERYAHDKKVLAQACPGLMEQVESCELTSKNTKLILKKYIGPLLDQGVDSLILGCTHYPFLLESIRELCGNDIEILETGKPVAIQLQRILKQFDIEKIPTKNAIDTEQHCNITFYNSSAEKQTVGAMLQLWHMKTLTKVDTVLPLPELQNEECMYD